VEPAVGLGALRLPGAEHGADRAPELFVDVLREGPAPEFLDQILVGGDQALEVGGVEIGVEVDALVLLGDLQRFLERAVIEAEHDVGVHLDEAAIAVPGEARSPDAAARPSTVSSLRPRLRTVSIIPGMETRAPERTETSSGSAGSPKRLPVMPSMWRCRWRLPRAGCRGSLPSW
jgi:hypothetical protein